MVVDAVASDQKNAPVEQGLMDASSGIGKIKLDH